MARIIRFLTVSTAAALLVTGLVAGSAGLARAQQADSQSDGWQVLPPQPAVAQPTKVAPLDVAGCWSGSIDDDTTGTGSGFVFFNQKGKRLVHGTTIGLSFNGGPSKSHGITGTVNSQNFKLIHPGHCKVLIRGTISSGDLVGSYGLSKHCLGQKFGGTFDYTFDDTGNSCQ
jgi:hypothetical protein